MSFARSTLKTSSLTQPCTHRRTQSFRSCFIYHKKFRERHQRCPCLNHSFRYSRLSKVMLFQPHDLVMSNSLTFLECKTFLCNSQQILRYLLKYYLVTKKGVRPQSSYWEVWCAAAWKKYLKFLSLSTLHSNSKCIEVKEQQIISPFFFFVITASNWYPVKIYSVDMLFQVIVELLISRDIKQY